MKTPLARRISILACLVVGALALALRLYYDLHAQPEIPIRADAAQYLRIAINVVDYGVFSDAMPGHGVPKPDSYRGPGYPSLIAVPLAFSGNIETTYWFVLVLQALLGAGMAVMVCLLARAWMTMPFALTAGLLAALWPHLIVQDACLLTESVFGFVLVVAVYLTSRALTSDRLFFYLIAAIAYGCAALVNSVIALLPLLVFWVIFLLRGPRQAFLFLILALVPPALWAIRDFQLDASVEMKSSGSRLFENVLVGLEPDFKPRGRDSDPNATAARERIKEGSALYSRDKRAAYLSVVTRIMQEPVRYMGWFLRKPVALWGWDVAQGAGDIYIYPMLTSPFEKNVVYRAVAAACYGLNRPLMMAAFGSAVLLLVAVFRARLRNQNSAY